MKKQGFGTTKDGKEALLYTLSNKNGMEISVTDYGAHLVSVLVPDKDGKKRTTTTCTAARTDTITASGT